MYGRGQPELLGGVLHALLNLLIFMTSLFCAQAFAAGESLMPIPSHVNWRNGRLLLTAKTTLSVTSPSDSRVNYSVERFVQRLQRMTGLQIAKTEIAKTEISKTDGNAVIFIRIHGVGLPVQALGEDESYRLTIDPYRAVIEAANPLGVIHALETLLQLVSKAGSSIFFPTVEIEDSPRFPWRGLMLDTVRHWLPVEEIQRNLFGMAAVKMNVLHLHLSDDQGFRMESKKFPQFQQLASAGLFYTQNQMHQLIALARNLGIRIVPEFDLPGHCTSWIVAFPSLGTGPGPFELKRTFWGSGHNAIDPSKPSAFELIDQVMAEMTGLFPDHYFHLGGDEVHAATWLTDPGIQSFMQASRLSGVSELQSYFETKVISIITKYGKSTVGWEEIAQTKAVEQPVAQVWHFNESLGPMIQAGVPALFSSPYYLTEMKTAASFYSIDPLPTGQSSNLALGGEALIWGELLTDLNVDGHIWPNTAAVAERLWSPASVTDVDDMYRRLEVESRRLEDLGLQHNQGYQRGLQRLVDAPYVPSLKVLSDVLKPMQTSLRLKANHSLSVDSPLNHLEDVILPETFSIVSFNLNVKKYLRDRDQQAATTVKTELQLWSKNDSILGPQLARKSMTAELILSQDLAKAARIGLEACGYLYSGTNAPVGWKSTALGELAKLNQPSGEMSLAIVDSILSLVKEEGSRFPGE